ncbi:MAG: endolytic transglycosylase MltG [Candidatus Doudnabacteria bacterium]
MKYKIFGALFILSAVGLALVGAKLLSDREARREQVANMKAPQVSWRAVEGWTISDMASDLEKRGLVTEKDFNAELKAVLSDYDFLGELKDLNPKPSSLEGYLFPDTYFIASKPTASSVVKKMMDNLEGKITTQMRVDIAKQDRSIYDVLTLASIIEKEVGRNTSKISSVDLQALQEERETVAGIFMNRLRIKMALQSDATIGYITKKNNPQASSSDLLIDSPYNTYKYRGLPPGPISNPSISAIKAAIYYKDTDYLYFLTMKDGTAVYAKTLDEHNANKRKYLK